MVIKFIRITGKMLPRFSLMRNSRQRYFGYLTSSIPFLKKSHFTEPGLNFIIEAAFAKKTELEPSWRSALDSHHFVVDCLAEKVVN